MLRSGRELHKGEVIPKLCCNSRIFSRIERRKFASKLLNGSSKVILLVLILTHVLMPHVVVDHPKFDPRNDLQNPLSQPTLTLLLHV